MVIWQILCLCFGLLFIWDLYYIIYGKPTRKKVIKDIVNSWFRWGGIGGVALFVVIGVLAAEALWSASTNPEWLSGGTSYSLETRILMFQACSIFLQVIFQSVIWIFIIDSIWSIFKKERKCMLIKALEYDVLSYTEEEKAYDKEQDDKFKEKMKKIFPFLYKDKKDGTF